MRKNYSCVSLYNCEVHATAVQLLLYYNACMGRCNSCGFRPWPAVKIYGHEHSALLIWSQLCRLAIVEAI